MFRSQGPTRPLRQTRPILASLVFAAMTATGLSTAAFAADTFRQSAIQSELGAKPPIAKQVPHTFEMHGDKRVDNYHWMRDPDYPTVDDAETLAHLKAENAYLDAVLGSEDEGLRKALFDEMLARIKQDDTGVPYREGDWEYQVRFETGKQYPIYVRRPWGKADAEFATILDVNALAEGKGYMRVSSLSPSPNGKFLAWTEDDDGSELLKVRVKDMTTGEMVPVGVEGTSYGLAWANDNKTFFYVIRDEFQRPKKVFRHTLGTDPKTDVLVHEETDGPWTVGIGRSLSGGFVYIGSQNNATGELRMISADAPTTAPTLLKPRQQNVEQSSIAHQGDTLWILTNDTHRNFRLVKAPAADPRPEN